MPHICLDPALLATAPLLLAQAGQRDSASLEGGFFPTIPLAPPDEAIAEELGVAGRRYIDHPQRLTQMGALSVAGLPRGGKRPANAKRSRIVISGHWPEQALDGALEVA